MFQLKNIYVSTEKYFCKVSVNVATKLIFGGSSVIASVRILFIIICIICTAIAATDILF